MNHGLNRRIYCCVLLFSVFLASKVKAFVIFRAPHNSRAGTPSFAPHVAATPNTEHDQQHNARAERFHSDMIRVLESRKQRVSASPDFGTDTTQRRHERPALLRDDVDGAERVLHMLQHMIELGVATETSFQIAMGAILKRGRLRWKKSNDYLIICAADQLEMLLQQLEYRDEIISVDTYNKVLEAYAVCATPRGDRNYAKRADTLLERMMLGDETSSSSWNVHSLVHTLHAWAWQQANRNDGECAERAQELLQQIENEELLSEDPALLMQCYDWVLEAWSKSKSGGSAEKADAIFRKMKKLNATMEVSALPNAESYSNVILAWTKCSKEGSAERAHSLWKEMLQQYKSGAFPSQSEPELIAFNGCMTAWARIGRLDKAEEILWEMDTIQKDCARLVPDVLTYNSVLHALVKSRDKRKALRKAIAIVQHMEDNCNEQPAITPGSFTYNSLMLVRNSCYVPCVCPVFCCSAFADIFLHLSLQSWVQSGEPDALVQAEAILSKMEKLTSRNKAVHVTNRNFNVVINAYAKSKDWLAASKAHRLLKRMEESNQVQPDIYTYTSVMECYSKSSDPNASVMAEELLESAFERYERTRDPSVMPNLRTFTMAIQALAQCPRQGNALKARELLTRLTERYESTKDESLRPNEYPYNYVINCAANTMGTTEEKIQAFHIATRTYQEMRNSSLVEPDSFTYAFWIKACNNLLPRASELHTKCISIALEQCKKDGLVTNEVLNRLKQGSSAKVVQSLLGVDEIKSGHGNLQVQDLPPVWSRNTQRWTSRQPR